MRVPPLAALLQGALRMQVRYCILSRRRDISVPCVTVSGLMEEYGLRWGGVGGRARAQARLMPLQTQKMQQTLPDPSTHPPSPPPSTVDLLKVDAECAELQVLQGVAPADWPKIGQLAMEVTRGHLRGVCAGRCQPQPGNALQLQMPRALLARTLICAPQTGRGARAGALR